MTWAHLFLSLSLPITERIAYVQQVETPFPNLMPVTFPQALSALSCQNFYCLSQANLPWLTQSPKADEPFRPPQVEVQESTKLYSKTKFSFPMTYYIGFSLLSTSNLTLLYKVGRR